MFHSGISFDYMIHVLDSSPLGLLSNSLANPEALQCYECLKALIDSGHRVLTSEICDYEVRRELLRANRPRGIDRRAAQLWAEARRRRRPTADPAALDADVILAAQVQLFAEAMREPVEVVTTNARHLQQFVGTTRWQEINP